jgi:predicted SPOUT superfamily RNA methylase MTH1
MTGVKSVLVPSSLTSTIDDDRLATYVIGTVGRAAAIFGVDEIVVYEDPQHGGGRRVTRVLEYQATAPYLRKRLFPISEELEHVGVLPPLNLDTHLAPTYVEEGQVRMAAMAGKRVDIGLDELAELDTEGDEQPEPGRQFPVEITATQADRVLVRPCDPHAYASFEVNRTPDLETAIEGRGPIIGTSREGEVFDADEHVPEEDCTLVFGTPERGLKAILRQQPNFPLVNTIPDQQTRSVRVEEALMASLSVFGSAERV